MTRRVTLVLCVLLGVWPVTLLAAPEDDTSLLAKLPGPSGLAVAFSRDAKLILTAGQGGARVWDGVTFLPLTPLLAEGKALVAARLSPDGARALTLAKSEARLWGATTGEAIRSLGSGSAMLVSAAFSPDGSMFAVGYSDGTARVCDARDGREVQKFRHGGPVYFTAFSPDSGKLLCLAADDPGNGAGPDRVYLWDARGAAVVWRKGCDDWLKEAPDREAAAFSPDGSRVATIHFRDVCLSDARTGEAVHSFETWGAREEGAACSLAFSPDGSLVATADDSTVRVWNAKTGRLARELERNYHSLHARSVCFGADGTIIAAAGSFEPRGPCAALWDVRTGDRLMEVQPEGRGDGSFPVVALSPKGRRVAAGFASDGFTGVYQVEDLGGK